MKKETTNKVTGKSKSELEEVDLSKGSHDDTEPKLVNYDNGTQTFEDTSMEKVTEPKIVQGAAKMDNIDPTTFNVDYIETPVVVREKRIIDNGGKETFSKVYENYKVSNPKKAEAKKAELEKKLNEKKLNEIK